MTVNQTSLFRHLEELVFEIGRDHYAKHKRYPMMTMRVNGTYWQRICMEMAKMTMPAPDWIPTWLKYVRVVICNNVPGVCITIDKA